MIVYKIEHKIIKKVYIGRTNRKLLARVWQHIRDHSPIGKAITDLGIENFDFQVVFTSDCVEQIKQKEAELILSYNCIHPNGYNQEYGKDNLTGINLNFDKNTKNWKLRTTRDKKRITLGSFHSREEALEYYDYCLKVDKWDLYKIPRVSKFKNNKFRLRVWDGKKRVYLGIFKTKEEAFNFYRKKIYG